MHLIYANYDIWSVFCYSVVVIICCNNKNQNRQTIKMFEESEAEAIIQVYNQLILQYLLYKHTHNCKCKPLEGCIQDFCMTQSIRCIVSAAAIFFWNRSCWVFFYICIFLWAVQKISNNSFDSFKNSILIIRFVLFFDCSSSTNWI